MNYKLKQRQKNKFIRNKKIIIIREAQEMRRVLGNRISIL